MAWAQRQGTIYAPRDYERSDGWLLFYDRPASRWAICDATGRAPQQRNSRNFELDASDVFEAQEWADHVLSEPRKGLRRIHASRVF